LTEPVLRFCQLIGIYVKIFNLSKVGTWENIRNYDSQNDSVKSPLISAVVNFHLIKKNFYNEHQYQILVLCKVCLGCRKFICKRCEGMGRIDPIPKSILENERGGIICPKCNGHKSINCHCCDGEGDHLGECPNRRWN
jgi:DnaJ-class molecular chaperone